MDYKNKKNYKEPFNIDEIEQNIYIALREFCDMRGITDLVSECQNRWNAALLYVHRKLFKGTDILKQDPVYIEDNGSYVYRTSIINNYDLEKLNKLVDVYINICNEFDKEISVMGFYKLSGVDWDYINSFGNNDNSFGVNGDNLTKNIGAQIWKKLYNENEESLSSKLVSGKGNPVGLLGVLNRKHGWNMGQPRTVTISGPTVSAAEIAARHARALIDDQEERKNE